MITKLFLKLTDDSTFKLTVLILGQDKVEWHHALAENLKRLLADLYVELQ